MSHLHCIACLTVPPMVTGTHSCPHLVQELAQPPSHGPLVPLLGGSGRKGSSPFLHQQCPGGPAADANPGWRPSSLPGFLKADSGSWISHRPCPEGGSTGLPDSSWAPHSIWSPCRPWQGVALSRGPMAHASASRFCCSKAGSWDSAPTSTGLSPRGTLPKSWGWSWPSGQTPRLSWPGSGNRLTHRPSWEASRAWSVNLVLPALKPGLSRPAQGQQCRWPLLAWRD